MDTGSAGPDLYTPWREEPTALRARHVGRADPLDALLDGAAGFAAGTRPLPLYLFGPRGIGKSHLLALATAQLRRDGVAVTLVPEDIAAHRHAARLVDRLDRLVSPRSSARQVVLLEGLDRHLRALGVQERRNLRRLLDERAHRWWLTGTGVTLGVELTGKDEAFYGAFDPWPLDALDDDDAGGLLDHLAATDDARWPARRATLLTLAGGHPRTLVALGRAVRDRPDRWATEHLHGVVRDFTAHYQMRFRDLSPQAQQIVEELAEAPREVTPSELAEALGTTASQMSVQAGRLVDEGVLRHRTEGRNSFYRLAEPLFRYWLEYRTASWEQTRTGWLGRLLEALMSPTELANTWWEHPSDAMRRAAGERLRSGEASWSAAWRRLVADARRAGPSGLGAALARARELPASPALGALVAPAIRHQLDDDLASLELPPSVRSVVAFAATTQSLRAAFTELVDRLAATPPEPDPLAREHLLDALVAALDRHRAGRSWRLRREERARLATVPTLRAYFAEHGRRPTHPPLLDPDDLLAALPDDGPLLDAARLVVVGCVRGHDGLVARAARGFDPASGWAFPPPPTPMRRWSAATAAAVFDSIARAEAPAVGLRWAASLGSLSDDRFAAAIATFAEAEAPPVTSEATTLALAALSLSSPDRFAAAAGSLVAPWRSTVDDARRLAAELAAASGPQPHPALGPFLTAIDEARP